MFNRIWKYYFSHYFGVGNSVFPEYIAVSCSIRVYALFLVYL